VDVFSEVLTLLEVTRNSECKMAAAQPAIFDLLVTLTSESIRISRSVLRDPKMWS